jgi:hypothetical protein
MTAMFCLQFCNFAKLQNYPAHRPNIANCCDNLRIIWSQFGASLLAMTCVLVWSGLTQLGFISSVKPGSHWSAMFYDPLSVSNEEENAQNILCINDHRQWASPMFTINVNQALSNLVSRNFNGLRCFGDPFLIWGLGANCPHLFWRPWV